MRKLAFEFLVLARFCTPVQGIFLCLGYMGCCNSSSPESSSTNSPSEQTRLRTAGAPIEAPRENEACPAPMNRLIPPMRTTMEYDQPSPHHDVKRVQAKLIEGAPAPPVQNHDLNEIAEIISNKQYNSHGLPLGWVNIPSLPRPYYHGVLLRSQSERPTPSQQGYSYRSGGMTLETLQKTFEGIRSHLEQLQSDMECVDPQEFDTQFGSHRPQLAWKSIDQEYWPLFEAVQGAMSLASQLRLDGGDNVKDKIHERISSANSSVVWKFLLSQWKDTVEDLVYLIYTLDSCCEQVRPPAQWPRDTQGQNIPYFKAFHSSIVYGNHAFCLVLFPGVVMTDDGKVICKSIVLIGDK